MERAAQGAQKWQAPRNTRSRSTTSEQALLKTLACGRSLKERKRRARILLLADEGDPGRTVLKDEEIAKVVGFHINIVWNVRKCCAL